MNKQHTLIYLKYGKLINDINDKITNQNIRSDMFKFLVNFPELMKYPNKIYQYFLPVKNTINKKIAYGSFVFYKNSINYYGEIEIDINFDGNNNFQLWTFEEINCSEDSFVNVDWILINNVKHYMNNHLNIFHTISN